MPFHARRCCVGLIPIWTLVSLTAGCPATQSAKPSGRPDSDASSHAAATTIDSTANVSTGGTLPFSVELGMPFTFDGVPGLHSYSFAHAEIDGTKWLLVGGRGTGLHGFELPTPNNPVNSFPPSGANDRLWVIDIANRKVWSQTLSNLAQLEPPLPPSIDIHQFQATNALACQIEDNLYVVGGYGYSPAATTAGQMMTFPQLSRFHVKGLVQAVMNGQSIAGFVQQVSDNRLKLTGGEMLPMPNASSMQLCAVFGQSFDGLYSVSVAGTGDVFQQKYSEVIRVFSVTENPLAIGSDYQIYPTPFVGNFTPPVVDGYPYVDFLRVRPYHRRDLNVLPAISPAGGARIGVYGGVFRPGQFDGYLNPIYIDGTTVINFEREGVPVSYSTFSPGTDHKFEQLLSQYRCAALPVFDSASGQMVTVFFGGISSYRYDSDANRLIKDPLRLAPNGRPIVDGVPFIQTVSALAVDKNGTSTGYILPITMPGYLGAEADLLIDPAVPQSANGVIQLDKLSGPTTIGYLFGGIQAFGPYTGELEQQGVKPTSIAYNQFIPVTITPSNSSATPMPPKPSGVGQ